MKTVRFKVNIDPCYAERPGSVGGRARTLPCANHGAWSTSFKFLISSSVKNRLVPISKYPTGCCEYITIHSNGLLLSNKNG